MLLSACLASAVTNSHAGISAPLLTATRTQPETEGIFVGELESTGEIDTILLATGEFYAIYWDLNKPGSAASQGAFSIGSITSVNGHTISGTGDTYGIDGVAVQTFSLTGAYQAKQSLSGTIERKNNTPLQFNAQYKSAYDNPATYANATGNFSGVVMYGNVPNAVPAKQRSSISLSVDAAGRITGSNDSCSFSGTLTPRQRGNVYDVSLSFADTNDCLLRNQVATGISVTYDRISRMILKTPLNKAMFLMLTKD